MAVNQAAADTEIRSQLVSTLESGHNHLSLAEATRASFPQGYWPGKGTRATPAQWRRSLQQLRADLDAVIGLVRDPARDLFATVPNSAGRHTFFRCYLVTADHNSYHIGELAIGRQVAGRWPKGRKG